MPTGDNGTDIGLSFHRGAHNWVASFDWAGISMLAYLSRKAPAAWIFGREDVLDVSTRGELAEIFDRELRIKLNLPAADPDELDEGNETVPGHDEEM